MKNRDALLLVGTCLLVAGCGWWQALQNSRAAALEQVFCQADAESSEPGSFSEIESTKAALNSLAYQVMVEVFARHEAALRTTQENAGETDPSRAEHLREYIEELKAGIDEFRGTEAEMWLVQKLLLTYKSERLYGPWLDLYLTALYTHPTHAVIGEFADEAVSIGAALNRESEVESGLRHLLEIPLTFESKASAAEIWELTRARTRSVGHPPPEASQ